MKILFLILLITIPLAVLTFKSGINVSINQKLFAEISQKIIPLLVDESKNIVVEDIHFSMKIALADLIIDLSNIKFDITSLPYEKIIVELQEPNLLNVSSKEMSGWGKFNIKLKYGVIPLSNYDIDITLKWVNIKTQIEIDSQKAEKHNIDIPKVKVSKIDLDLDFQFDMPDSIFGKIIDLVASIDLIRDSVKNMIKQNLVSVINNIVISDSESIISKILNELPLYANIYKNIAAEYALIHKPFVYKNNFILSFKGTIVDPNIDYTWNPPYPLMELPFETQNSKTIEIFVSPYVINSGLFTLTASKFTFVLRDSDIPESSSFRLDTTSLRKFLSGLDKFPDHTPCELEMNLAPPSPVVNLQANDLKISPTVLGVLYVILPDGRRESELTFQTNLGMDIKLAVFPNGEVKAHLEDFSVHKTKILDSKIGNILVWVVEKLLNASMIIVRPIINSKFLDKLQISLPVIQGIQITDSNLFIRDTFIEVDLSPSVIIEKMFTNEFLKELRKKRNRKIENENSDNIKFLD